jgi:hypothetical protein
MLKLATIELTQEDLDRLDVRYFQSRIGKWHWILYKPRQLLLINPIIMTIFFYNNVVDIPLRKVYYKN